MTARVFFEVIKRLNRVKEGAVIHLSTQLDCITVGVDIALPNMLKYVVWLDGVAWHQLHKHRLMDGVGRKAYNQRLELAVDGSAVCATGRQLKLGTKRS